MQALRVKIGRKVKEMAVWVLWFTAVGKKKRKGWQAEYLSCVVNCIFAFMLPNIHPNWIELSIEETLADEKKKLTTPKQWCWWWWPFFLHDFLSIPMGIKANSVMRICKNSHFPLRKIPWNPNTWLLRGWNTRKGEKCRDGTRKIFFPRGFLQGFLDRAFSRKIAPMSGNGWKSKFLADFLNHVHHFANLHKEIPNNWAMDASYHATRGSR